MTPMLDQPRYVIMTTDTPHHLYFVREMVKRWPPLTVIVEERPPSVGYDTVGSFDQAAEAFEIDRWFDGKRPQFSDFADVWECVTVNDKELQSSLADMKPDIILTYGVGRLNKTSLALAPSVINLQGTSPAFYCGLDTIYWASYHRDFKSIGACLHEVKPDDHYGNVVLLDHIDMPEKMEMYELRAHHAELAVQVCNMAFRTFCHFGQFIGQPLAMQGRFYSFMPNDIKEFLATRFAAYLRQYNVENYE